MVRTMKLLLLTRNMPPIIGGMERLIWHIADELSAEYEVQAVAPTGSADHAPKGIEITEAPISPLWRFLVQLLFSAFFISMKWRPQIIFAGSGLTAPIAYILSRLTRAKAIVYLHGLDIEIKNLFYRLIWMPLIRRCDRIIVNSNNTRRLAIAAGIDESHIDILHPGVDLPDLAQAQNAANEFLRRYNLHHTPLMLYVGRINERKGLFPFVQNILPMVIEGSPSAKLIVIGDEPKYALHQGRRILDKVHSSIDKNHLQEHVIFLGSPPYHDPELTNAYFACNALVFPVQDISGDAEGFGMVALEASAHGTPTVAFSAGGVPDAVKDGVSGRLFNPGDDTGFAECLINYLDYEKTAPDMDCRSFAESFSWKCFGEKLRHICLHT